MGVCFRLADCSLAGGLTLGTWGDYSRNEEVMATAEQERDFVPSVRVATVEPSPGFMTVSLPGTTAAFAAANIYARATGYIAKRNVDIGDHIKTGEALAELAVPELDDQISQNEATLGQLKSALEQSEASLKLAQVTWSRDEPLVNKGWATQQQGTVDVQTVKVREAAVAVAQQNVTAQQSLVKQLRQNRDYASVAAPFDGVITQRNVDVGSLVQGNATGGTFMFEIIQKDVIRVWAYVPQDAAFGVAPGVDAVVRVPELPNRAVPGQGNPDRRCAAERHAHASDRDRPAQSGRRPVGRHLLHGRAQDSAQGAVLCRARRGHHLQP